jgi:hypothetical protein
MTRGLRTAILLTDWLMISYWAVTALVALGLISLPPDMLYKDYANPIMVAWNWSFMPLDIGFSVFGLISVRLERRGDPRWRGMTILSLALTFCAGLMAIVFWTIRADFDPAWWIPNLAMMLWPWLWLPHLIGEGA